MDWPNFLFVVGSLPRSKTLQWSSATWRKASWLRWYKRYPPFTCKEVNATLFFMFYKSFQMAGRCWIGPTFPFRLPQNVPEMENVPCSSFELGLIILCNCYITSAMNLVKSRFPLWWFSKVSLYRRHRHIVIAYPSSISQAQGGS